MKRLLLATALIAGGTLGIENVTWAHGGQYRGPGDTVPPGGAGGGGGGGPASGPRAPGSPPGSGPGSPGSGAPGAPGAPGGAPTTGGGSADLGPDLTLWSFWWEFNKEPYLNLKAAIHGDAAKTGSDGFFLGRGQKEQGKDSLRPTEAQIRQKVVPALLDALENETNNDIVTGCMVALAKIGDERDKDGESAFEQVIAKFLSDSNQEISETAAVALGILANEKSIGTLQHLLDDDAEGRKLVGRGEVNFRTRAFAAYGLGLIGANSVEDGSRSQIVEVLVNAIANDDTKSRDLKVAAIIAMGLVPLETIEPETAPAEGEALPPHQSRIGQIDYLLGFLADETQDYLVRAHVPTALARLLQGIPGQGEGEGSLFEQQKDRVVPVLMELFDKRSKEQNEVIQSAVLAMGLIGDADQDKLDTQIRKALASVPKDHSNTQTRNFALIAMAKAGSNRGGRADASELEDGVKDAAKFLLDQLSKGKSILKPWAGLSIGVMGRRLADAEFGAAMMVDLSGALRSSLDDEKNPQRVGAYAIGAGILNDRDSQSILMQKLEDIRDDEARGYIAVALGLGNVRDAIEQIQTLVNDSQYRPDLLKQAAIALGLLGDKALVEKLTQMLKDANNLATQAAISSALGFIGDARSIDPLVEMLGDDQLTETARGFAAVALGIVADKEPLPWNSKIAVDLNYRASTTTLTDSSSGTGILDIL